MLDVLALADRVLTAADQVSVTVYDGTNIYNLAAGDFTVDAREQQDRC